MIALLIVMRPSWKFVNFKPNDNDNDNDNDNNNNDDDDDGTFD